MTDNILILFFLSSNTVSIYYMVSFILKYRDLEKKYRNTMEYNVKLQAVINDQHVKIVRGKK